MGELFATFGLNVPLLITQVINFGILLLGLWWFLYRPAIRLLDERQEKIRVGVESAEAAQVRLKEIEGERDDVLKKATQSAEEILGSSKERAQEQASEIVSDANTRADAILDSANKRAEETKERALRESKEEIGKAAILAAEKVLREKQS